MPERRWKITHATPAAAPGKNSSMPSGLRAPLSCADASLSLTSLELAPPQAAAMAPTVIPHKKIVKKRTLKFSRHQSDEFVKVRAAWRRPRGIDSRQRIK